MMMGGLQDLQLAVPPQTEGRTRRVGLVAGWGRFPILVAESLRNMGCEVYCCGIRGHADPELEQICTRFKMFGLAKMGAQLRFFRRNGVSEATMAGKIFKTLLLKKFHFVRHLPDLTCIRHFYPMYISKTKDRKDDTLLTTVTNLYAEGGVQFSPATDLVPELLVNEGALSNRPVKKNQFRDIKFGWQLAKEMGRLDVGQSVAVKDRAVLAIEAVEGTDECIRRAGQLCSYSDFVVVKVAKPKQDMRFDVPTIGMSTIETMSASGARVLAVEAGKTIVLDRDAVVQRANELKISIVALPSDFLEREMVA